MSDVKELKSKIDEIKTMPRHDRPPLYLDIIATTIVLILEKLENEEVKDGTGKS